MFATGGDHYMRIRDPDLATSVTRPRSARSSPPSCAATTTASTTRGDLVPFAAKAVGTRGSRADRRASARRCAEWNPETGAAPRRRLLLADSAPGRQLANRAPRHLRCRGYITDMDERCFEAEPHRAAVLDTEVRCLECTLRTYRVLTREHLAELSGATHWHEGRLRQAIDAGVQRGVLSPRGRDFVELPPDRG
jgi:hypothetical protein